MNERLYQYAGSLIALQRQADMLERMLREGGRRWAGQPTKNALAATLEAIVADSGAASKLSGLAMGDNQWLDAKRDWALDRLREHGLAAVADASAEANRHDHQATSTPAGTGADYELNLDGPMLCAQRQLVTELLDNASQSTLHVFRSGQQAVLEGLLSLLEELVDQAHDRHGLDSLEEPDGP